jgi:hypothetical protein
MYLEFSTSRLTAICYGCLNIKMIFGFVSTSLMELGMKANELFGLINCESNRLKGDQGHYGIYIILFYI